MCCLGKLSPRGTIHLEVPGSVCAIRQGSGDGFEQAESFFTVQVRKDRRYDLRGFMPDLKSASAG